MSMYAMIYIEVNALCVMILSYILLVSKHNIDKQAQNMLFSYTVTATLVILVVDAVWMYIDGKIFPNCVTVNYIINIVYFMDAALISYCWLLYAVRKANRNAAMRGRASFLLALPLLAFFLLCITTPWTRLVFSIDAYNAYHRGVLYPAQLVTSFGYMAAATVYVFICIRREVNRQRRADMRSLLYFMILPTLGGALNACIYGLPATWPATTLAILVVFIDIQRSQISMDALTGLNNRRQFDRYINAASEGRKTACLYLILMDVDDFKRINDTYGHVEGDKALMQTAEALKAVCKSRDAFLARYGGDEFAILYSCEREEDILQLSEEINMRLAEDGRTSNRPYAITLSLGYQAYQPGRFDKPEAWIASADEKLYEAKNTHQEGKSA